MAFGVYLHIPYCLQRCSYCDFTTFEADRLEPIELYVEKLLREIRGRRSLLPFSRLDTVYFGGGTPSLLDWRQVATLLTELRTQGLMIDASTEVTLEVNPATLSPEKLEGLLEAGVNRLSVGAQSFNDAHLRRCGRRHTAVDTRRTLELVQTYGVNYSFDLLFGLPYQTIQELEADLDQVAAFRPPHLSAYCLTVPEGHPMSYSRPREEVQVAMFDQIESRLADCGMERYEISNFARPGFESRHNILYWTDQSFWGLGLSAHSYLASPGFGRRFWNPKDPKAYEEQLARSVGPGWLASLPESQWEALKEHESLTDFCHMHLRMNRGLPVDLMRQKFGSSSRLVFDRSRALIAAGWVEFVGGHLRLTREGRLLSNQVFLQLTFSEDELRGLRGLESTLTFHASNPT